MSFAFFGFALCMLEVFGFFFGAGFLFFVSRSGVFRVIGGGIGGRECAGDYEPRASKKQDQGYEEVFHKLPFLQDRVPPNLSFLSVELNKS